MNLHDSRSLARVMAPIEVARGLPNAFYTEPAALEEERRRIFARSWSCIGFAKDVPEKGDALPVDFLGIPLLLLRDQEGEVRVFQNVCRHRGRILVDAPTRLKKTLRCPYHSWCYGLDGKLKTTPHIGGPGKPTHEAVDRKELGLFAVRSAVWMDLVFVDLSDEAPAFEDFIAPLAARWADFVSRPLYHGGPDSSFALDVACNWKLAVENYCEAYHLPWVHPGLNRYSKLEDHYNIVDPAGFSGQGTRVYAPPADPQGRNFARFEGLDAKWDSGAEYVALYPNLLLGVHKDHTYAILLEPKGLDRTVERVEIYYASPEMQGEDYAALRRHNAELWRGVFVEDVTSVEGMQRGRAAPAFDGGKFSPVMDPSTHSFHAWVAGRLAAAD